MNKELGFGMEISSTDSGGLALSRRWLGRNEHIITASPREMRTIAEALMAALGEPVEAKPESDRSALNGTDAGSPWLIWYSDMQQPLTRPAGSSVDGLIEDVQLVDVGTSIYKLVAYVGPKPQPAERKVVRL